MVKCPNCEGRLKEVSRERTLPDPDFVTMSDDEMIDFFSEDITGEYTNWGMTEVHFKCMKCGKRFRLEKK